MSDVTPISDDELEFLAEKFACWQHPAVRDPARAALLGGGDTDQARSVFEVLLWFASCADPAAEPHPSERLGDQVAAGLADVIRTSLAARRVFELATRSLVMSVEPFCFKVLARLAPERYLELRSRKAGLVAVISALREMDRIPYRLHLSGAEFERADGWDQRTSYENAVRDIIPARIESAHHASAVAPHLWESVIAFLTGIVDANLADLIALRDGDEGNGRSLRRAASGPSGLPPHRRIVGQVAEPLTTRRPVADRWRRLIEEDLGAQGRVVVIDAAPGWGKSTFLSLALDALDVPIHFVELANVREAHELSEAILMGIRLSPERRSAIDRSPLSSVRFLSEYLARPGVVVFESTERAVEGIPPANLGAFVQGLHRHGHLVVLESWTSQVLDSLVPRPSLVRFCTTSELPPISPDELAAWGRIVLGRSLTKVEIEALDVFEGHPMALQQALRMLKARYATTPDVAVRGSDVTDDILDLCLTWDSVVGAFEPLISRSIGRTKRGGSKSTGVVPSELLAWFGFLPWATPTVEMLGPELHTLARRIQEVGIVRLEAGRYYSEPWARILGLRFLASLSEVSESVGALLQQMAPTVPVERSEHQRRHLSNVAGASPALAQTCLSLLEALAALDPAEGIDDGEDVDAAGPYVAPPSGRLVTELRRARQDRPLPTPLQMWLLEGAGRLNDTSSVREVLVLAQSGRDPGLVDALASDWRAIKALQRAIVSLDVAPTERWKLYDAALQLIPPDRGDTNTAYRAWTCRLLVSAAECARTAGDRDAFTRLLDRTAALHGSIARPDQAFARYLYDDVRYRIAAAFVNNANSLGALLELNRQALATIPAVADWSPDRFERWTSRELRHLRLLVPGDPADSQLQDRLWAALRRIPMSERFLLVVGDLIRRGEHLGGFQERLRRFARARLARAAEAGTGPVRIRRLASLVLDESLDSGAAESWAAEAVESLEAGDFGVISGLRICLAKMTRDGMAGSSVPLAAARLAERCLASMPLILKDLVHGDEARRLHAICVDTLAMRLTWRPPEARAAEFESDVESACRRLQTTSARIDSIYEKSLAIGGSPWLWDDWAQWKVELTRRRVALERQRHAPDLSGRSEAETLLAFVEKCDRTAGSAPASDAAGIRVYRYLWRFGPMRARLERFVRFSGDFGERSRVVEIAAEALTALAFTPDALRAADQPPLNREEVALVQNVLRESLIRNPSPVFATWVEIAYEALARLEDASFWLSVVEKARALVGDSEDLWARLINHAESRGEPDSDRILEGLTSPSVLQLISRVCHLGAGVLVLPRELRRNLAEFALVAALDLEAWERSITGRPMFLSHWYLGTSIGLGLSAGGDGKLFGRIESFEVDRRGRRRTWSEWMDKELNAAYSSAAGEFRRHSREIWSRFRDWTGGRPLAAARRSRIEQ